MTNMDEFAEIGIDTAQGAVAETDGKFCQSSELEGLLDFIDRFTFRRRSNTKTVPCKGRVAMLVDSLRDIAIVVTIKGKIPITAINSNTMC
jgi:hypothetical protein